MASRTTGLQAIVDHHGAASSWYLIVAFGDGRGTRVIPIDDGADLIVGREADCAIIVDDDAISRRHAAIRRRGDAITVADLGSRNGTHVNGAVVKAIRRVTAGDLIALGPATAIVATSSPMQDRQLATIDEFEERLEIEIERATRYRRPLGLAMLRLEGNSDAVTAHVQQLLRRLRRMDLVAEYGPDELALVLPETAGEPTMAVALRAAVADGVTGRVGVAAFPDDGTSAGELVGSARARLRDARTDGPKPREDTRVLKSIIVDPVMKQVYNLAARAAATTINVLVVGETGSGKEVVADAIHRGGARANRAFVRINCAALSESLVESELFGHEAGAFTGAIATKRGIFEAATGGTLFLDEVGELPLATQVKLLRALESRRIVRVGGTAEIAVDIRLVSATNRDLEAEVTRGRFREDLFYRIAAFVIPVPPLRDRPSEIVPLAVQFAHEIATELRQPPVGFTPEALDALNAGDWPGNVRELRNVIERAVVLSAGEKIDRRHLPEQLIARARIGREAPDIRQHVANVERDMLRAALDAAGGNQTQAAKRLGISRFALIRMIAKHDLKR